MKIAVPLADGRLSLHFGLCRELAVIEVDEQSKQIVSTEVLPAPEHEPGALPRWLSERGVELIIAGGMGSRARQMLQQKGIRAVVGASAEAPEAVVTAYLNGQLELGDNICQH